LKFFLFIQGVVQLAIVLSEEREDHIKAAAAWALGQIGRHTPEHAKAVAVANVLPKLLQCFLSTESSEDLSSKVCLIFGFFIICVCHTLSPSLLMYLCTSLKIDIVNLINQ